MDIELLIQESEQNFNELERQRAQLLKQAEDCLTEMTKLQGEYRVLNKMRVSDHEKTSKESLDTTPVSKKGK